MNPMHIDVFADVAAAIAACRVPRAPRWRSPSARAPTCGVVQIDAATSRRKARASGVGVVAGGVVGGVLGHQIGSGRGNTAATIVGAGAGAYAGNEVEKNKKKKTYWTVTMQDGQRPARTFTYGEPAGGAKASA